MARWLQERPRAAFLTRSRPYRKNDDAHVEQRNWTHVRQPFGHERYDNPAVVPLINAPCRGALGQLQTAFSRRPSWPASGGQRVVRVYGKARTPYARVLERRQVGAAQKEALRAQHRELNPFQLSRDIERQKRVIEARRLARA